MECRNLTNVDDDAFTTVAQLFDCLKEVKGITNENLINTAGHHEYVLCIPDKETDETIEPI